MQIQRRYQSGILSYFAYDDGKLLGRANTLHAACTRDLEPVSASAQLGDFAVPTAPTKIICVGLNYRQHAEEMGKALPSAPLLFMKPLSALLAQYGTILRPPESNEVHYEAELAVVIGKHAKRVAKEDVHHVIAGYTLINDVTARDIQRHDVQYTRGKSFDTFAPVGPCVQTIFDPSKASIRCRVNGELRQESPLSDMVFSVPEIVSYISHMMTLEPGDIIATGTPSGVGELHDGDVVEVEIEEIGILKNTVSNG